MITEEMLKKIANVFNGDDENSIYEYKTGSDCQFWSYMAQILFFKWQNTSY